MDRNARTGILLLVLLYAGWFFLFAPKQQPRQPATPTESAQEAPPAVDQWSPGPSQTEPTTTPVAIDSREIVVVTNLARYTLDTHGATLRAVKLLKYDGINGGSVELLSHDSQPALTTGFDTPGDVSKIAPVYTCDFNEDSLQVRPGDKAVLTFTSRDDAGGLVTKTYTFHPESYEFGLRVSATLDGSLAASRSSHLAWSGGVLSTEKNRKDDLRSFNSFSRVGENQEKKGLKHFRDANSRYSAAEGTVGWLGSRTKYFLAAIIPDGTISGIASLTGNESEEALGFRVDIPLRGGLSHSEQSWRVYAGPLIYDDLKLYGNGIEELVDMGKLIRPISVAIKWMMSWLSRFIPNYGIIIILLSIFTKVLFYRLTHKSFKSMKDMQDLQPELQALQEKYKNQKDKLSKATMELYKKHGVNPLGGCLPLLLQMPVFFALFKVLRSSVELRGAGFVSWINDLSTMDVIYRLPFEIPILGSFIDNSISVLPILMGVSMWVQTRLGGSGMGGSVGQPTQAQAMNKIMPFFMTFIFYKMPSGLVLYWLVNNILTVVQQYYIHKGSSDDGPKVVPAGQ